MRFTVNKKWMLNFLVQAAVVFLAFALMVITSYFFVSRIENENLRNRVKEAISYTEANIRGVILEGETNLAGIAQTIRGMILRGDSVEAIQEYVLDSNNYVQSNEETRFSGIIGFYGIFDVYGNVFKAGDPHCIPEEDYALQDCPWYIKAVEAEGDVGITQPHIDNMSGEGSVTFSRRIFDENGTAFGIVCLDINLDRLKQLAIHTRFAENSYGFLLNENLEIIAHPDSSILGMELRDVNIGIAISDAELRLHSYVSEFKTTNSMGVESVLFVEKLYNNWYMGIITPKIQYYHSTRNLAMILVMLGTVLAVMLVTILLRLSAEKNKADERMHIMFDTMPLGANIHNKDFKFLDCNESVLVLFDLSSKQEYFDKFDDLSPEYQPDGRLSKEAITKLIDKAFLEGYCRFEWMHRKLNGEPIPCEITLVRVNYDNEYVLVVYIRDLRELKKIMKGIEYREHLLNTVNTVAGILLAGNDENSFDVTLMKSFKIMGYCMDVDRIQIWRNEFVDGKPHFVLRYEWLSDYGRNCIQVPMGLHFPYSERPDWERLFLRGEHINAPISGLTESDRDFLNTYGMKSIVIIPMFLDDVFWGFFSIDDCRQERTFSNEEIHILTSVGLMMSNVINRNMQTVKLREADDRVRVMLDAVPMGANFWDKNYNIIDCNMESVKIFDLARKSEYCERFYELSPEYQPDGRQSKEKAIELLKKAFDQGYCRFEWMHQKINGEPVPCIITLVRVEYREDFIVAGYTYDLRELKNTIAQMNESRRSLNIMENILNGIDASVYVTIPDTCEILFINNYMKKHFNLKFDCIGQLCYKVFLNTDKKCDFCPCQKLDKEPDSAVVWEIHNPITERIYRCMDRYIEWYDGRIVHIQHSVDVTELISAKELAEQSSRFKSQFLSRMSHEVRTPMNVILGITEIQLQNEKLHPDIQEALSKISNSSYLLLGIINDILDMSKIEAGKLELVPLVYDVASLISDTLNVNIFKYDDKPIKFSLVADENIPAKLLGDELRIKQILNNLLSNAYKYTDKGEISMSISVEYMEGNSTQLTLVFRVTDTGQGMTGEQLDKLFDEYIRFNMETNRKAEGAGLGMSITRHLVSLMNGEISVESEPDKGSVFTVRLPQGITDSGALGGEVVNNLMQFRHVNMRQIKKTSQIVREFMPYGRVLIVDDMETNLYVTRGLMAPYCLSVETAISGFDAIQKIKNGATFDIIFMDHFMPKMDGIDTTKIIRGLGYKQPIVALTANALAGMAEMFMENGFDGFISKPIDIRQLNSYLNKFIRDKYPPEVVKAAQKQAAIIKISAGTELPSYEKELNAAFVRDAEKALEKMEIIHKNAYRRKDDIRQFVIHTHALKSTLTSIGETWLSSTAFELERAGRAENVHLIKEKTPAFLESLHTVIEKHKPKEDGGDMVLEDSDNNTGFLGEKLLVIQTACEGYDEITANAALSELLQKKWSNSVKNLLDSISEYLLHSDFDEAAAAAKDYIKDKIPSSF
jgi:signal transduction histidine kinase/CheY-like chemotaxis protein/PAS domain-containing protein